MFHLKKNLGFNSHVPGFRSDSQAVGNTDLSLSFLGDMVSYSCLTLPAAIL